MYIHKNENWPNFTWNKEVVNERLNAVNRTAGFLAGKLSVIGLDAQMSAVVESVAHDIVASSEIEGIELNNEQVRSSVARRLGVDIHGSVPSSRYIDGVVKMALDATVNYSSPLTDERLFGWHNSLFPTGWSGDVIIDVAKYRRGEMKVVSGVMGREKVHYIAPEANNVAAEMERFLEWFNSADNTGYLKSAIAHLWFVCIHPFDDGNGRIGRAIADMALSQAEDSQMRYFSISHQINKEKKQYYRILEKTQKGTCDITEWLAWYLDCLSRAIEHSGDILSKVLNKATFWQNNSTTTISERQKMVLNIYLDGYEAKLTVKNWAKHAKISTDTAARDIKDLVDKNVLVPQEGRVRDIFYGIKCSDSVITVPLPNENI